MTQLQKKTAVISGASGMIGSALGDALQRKGWRVRPLVRRDAQSPDEIAWSPESGVEQLDKLEGVDAVIHLAGENIAGGRWTDEHKQRVFSSRVMGTLALAKNLAELESPPAEFVSASAIGFYGDRGGEIIDETSGRGEGFLPDVCEAWEDAAQPARDKGIRVVHPRIGVVLSSRGGALQKMLLPFRMGLGGKLGDGKQYMSWVSLADVVRAIYFMIENDELNGPVNVTASGPVTNAEFTRVLGKALKRPAVLPVPATVLRLALGEMADEMLLGGARVLPRKLQEAGFEFRHKLLAQAIKA